MSKLVLSISLLSLVACSTSQSQNTTKSNNVAELPQIVSQGMLTHPDVKGASVSLDEKSRTRIHEGFKAIISNDDKKAKLSYGRAHKNMPSFLQFAYDLRFRNFDRAKEVVEKLPYTADEKIFWKNMVDKKPAVISKYVCDAFKESKFEFKHTKPDADETDWFGEYVVVIEQMQKDLAQGKTKKPEMDKIFEKYSFVDDKKMPLALTTEAQKEILTTEFFDKFRNMQRRDSNFYKANYWNIAKVVGYTPYFTPHYAWDLYRSINATDHTKKNHFKRRLKGIIKDMRTNLVMQRLMGSNIIEDEDDYKKAYALAFFINRYPFISAFLRFDFTLAECAYNPQKE